MPGKTNKRKYPDGTNPRPDLSELKQAEAAERQAFYDGLSVEVKIGMLDKKFGVGQGAKKQRAKFVMVKAKPTLVEVKEEKSLEQVSEKKHLKAKERRSKEKKEN